MATPGIRFRGIWFVAACLLIAACNDSADGDQNGLQNAAPGAVAQSRCGDIDEHPWCNTALSADERARLLLAEMTLRQKIDLMGGDDTQPPGPGGHAPSGRVAGIPELGIPDLYMSDSVAGSTTGQATGMPAPLALGASFNRELAYRAAGVIGAETRFKGIDLILAPSLDVMRNPLHGRTFESYGEDPYLAGELGVEWVRGIQDQGVIANLKHYAVNTQEGQIQVVPLIPLLGMRYLVDAVVDERTLREIYLPPFEAAVKEGNAGTVMCAYNRVNGSPACSNRHLLQEVLRDDWGFDGFVVSDWYTAAKDTVNSVNNGMDIEMPSALWYTPELLQLAVQAGAVGEDTINERVGNILRTLFRFGVFDRPAFPVDENRVDKQAHQDIARETAEQGMVLLRNEGLLPLDADELQKIALIGRPTVEYQRGFGSSEVSPHRVLTPLEQIQERVGPEVEVVYDPGSDPATAAAVARSADVAIVFGADLSSEGVDKLCLSLDCSLTGLPLGSLLDPLYEAYAADAPSQDYLLLLFAYLKRLVSDDRQDELIAAVAAANPHTAAVLSVGGPVLTPWREELAALLVQWYPGQEGGAALARVLFGDTDPGGRLPVSFPATEADTPVAGNPFRYPGVLERAEYSEGIFVGYRWHDENDVTPAYAFGEGLSYTKFEHSNLSIEAGDNAELRVKLQVTNTGDRAGWTVPQVYLGKPSTPQVPQPPRVLRGFDKRWLQPGEQASIELGLGRRAFSYWDTGTSQWQIQPGCYEVLAGASSRNLPLSAALNMGPHGGISLVESCQRAD